MQYYHKHFLFLLLVIIFIACSQKKEKNNPIIAEVDGEYLYTSEIKKNLPIDYTIDDSIKLSEEYINNWRFERLAYKKAVASISDSTELIEKIQKYRHQLYIDAYMNNLIDEEIDYVIDSMEIKSYYENNLNEYLLPITYVKAHYITFSAKLSNYYHILEKMQKSTSYDYEMLKKFCIGTNREVVFKKDWISLNEFLLSINYNQQITDEELPYKDIMDFVNNDRRIIVKIDDYVLKGEKTPFDLVKEDIVQIIINNRKRAKYIEIKNKIIGKDVK